MATASFTSTFNIVTQKVTFTDISLFAGQGVPLADVNGSFKITAPSGTVVYNNVDYTNGGCDIDLATSLNSQQTVSLPLTSGNLIEPGVYTIVYTVYNSVLAVYYTVTQTYTFSYISPVVYIEQTVDCLSPLFTSTDITEYTVNSIVPTKVEVHTIYFPNGSEGQGSPVIGSGLVVTTSTFYNGTQTTTISSTLTYVNSDGLIISDVITGSEEILVDCTDICGIYCCIRTVEQTMDEYRITNQEKYKEYRAIFSQVMGYAAMVTFAIRCGKSDEVSDLMAQLRIIAKCTDDCGCSDGEPTQVTGLGGLINNIVVNSCGNGVIVTPVEVGNTITYTVCLSTAFVNLVNSFYNTIVEQGNNIVVAGPDISGITRTFTVSGQKTLLTAGNNITVTLTYQVSGVLVVGTQYTIANYVATDNFTNVGGTNVTGNVFIATGTTPTTWTNGSSLQITGTSTYNVVGIGPVVAAGDSSVTVTPSTASGFTTYTITAFGIQRKFVKQFTTVDIEQNLDISYVERTACDSFPGACTPDGTDPNNYTDLHVQVWLNSAMSPTEWILQIHGTSYSSCTTNSSTGLLRVITGNNQGTYRVVVLF